MQKKKEINKYSTKLSLKRLLANAQYPAVYLSFKTGLLPKTCRKIVSQGVYKVETAQEIAESLGMSLLEFIYCGYVSDIQVSPLKIESAYRRKETTKKNEVKE